MFIWLWKVTAPLPEGKDYAGCQGGLQGGDKGEIQAELTPNKLKGELRKCNVAFVQHLLYVSFRTGTLSGLLPDSKQPCEEDMSCARYVDGRGEAKPWAQTLGSRLAPPWARCSMPLCFSFIQKIALTAAPSLCSTPCQWLADIN